MKHKRFFCLLCVLVLCFAALSPAFAEQAEDTGDGYEPTPTNWMQYLDENLYMHQINIPGTHDSGTISLPELVGRCQSTAINTQLNMGARFLDIRLGVLYRMVDGRKQHYLQVFHGSLNCKLSFDQVLDWCSSFLRTHPSEFIVMSVKEDPDPQGGSEYNTAQMMEQYIAKYNAQYPGLFYTENRIPQVKEVRGKIVLMRRYSNGNCPPIGIDARSHWPNDSTGIYENVTHLVKSDGTRVAIRLGVQDAYTCSNVPNGKWTSWNNMWKQIVADEDTRTGSRANQTLWINFASGCDVIGGAIGKIAEFMAKGIGLSFIGNYNKGEIRGIVPMDYIVGDVVKFIYASNKLNKTAQQPPSVYGINETVAGYNDGKLRLMDGYTNTGRIQYRLNGAAASEP